MIDSLVWGDGEMDAVAKAIAQNDPNYTDPNCE
jgi:hypothetical protein